MTTLAANISAAQRVVSIAGDVSSATLGHLYCVDDEIILLESFGEIPPNVGETRPIGTDRTTWRVQRGVIPSHPADHTSGTGVYAVTYGFTRGSTSLADASPVMSAAAASHPDLATHDALGLATDAELATHVAAPDPHIGYALDADLANHEADTTAIHGIADTTALVRTTDSRLADARTPTAHTHTEANVTNLTSDLAAKAASSHSHAESDVTSLTSDLSGKASTGHTHVIQAFPVGALYLSVTSTDPATSLGYGTWSQVAQGLLLIGQSGVQAGAAQVGNATHSHTFTQPSDHTSLTHAGAAVANHVVTQPGAHSSHVFTQPTGHSNHVVTQPNAHADNIAHTHGLNVQGGTTAATTGTHVMTSTATGGSARAITTGDAGLSQGTGSSLVHAGTAVDAHSGHSGGAVDAHSAHSGAAVDAHAVTQPNGHTISSHAGGAVATGTTDPPAFVAFVWQRTA